MKVFQKGSLSFTARPQVGTWLHTRGPSPTPTHYSKISELDTQRRTLTQNCSSSQLPKEKPSLSGGPCGPGGQVCDPSTQLLLVPAPELPAGPHLSPFVLCLRSYKLQHWEKLPESLQGWLLIFISKKPPLPLDPNRPQFLSASFLQWPHAGPSPHPFIASTC